MTVGWMQLYASVREAYNGKDELEETVHRLRQEAKEQRVKFALEREQFLEFRQNVAALMPNILKEKGMGEEGYPYRSLASLSSRGQNDPVRGAISKTLFERGKENFNRKEYAKATKIFRQIIDRYGYSPYAIESYFLLSESHFRANEYEECTKVIMQMIELFPNHELTGFAMIRLGRIFEAQNRNEEAVDMYKTVLRSFPQRDVASQAKSSLRGLDL